MQSIVSIKNKKGSNNYIKFERNVKFDRSNNLFNDIGIIIIFYKNMKDN